MVAAATPGQATVELRNYYYFAVQCLGLDREGILSSLRSTVTRALGRLADLKLITIEQKHHNRVVIRLLALDGSGGPYAMPRRNQTKVVYVPTGVLFQNAWHQRLTQTELTALLVALTEETYQFKKFGPHQWEKSRDKIAIDYGLAPSTRSKGKDGLYKLGLLEWTYVPPSRRQRRDVTADRYTVHADVLSSTPEEVPQYARFSEPITTTSRATGRKLQRHLNTRVELPARTDAPKVVPLRRSGRSA
jgi:hypothetical protein